MAYRCVVLLVLFLLAGCGDTESGPPGGNSGPGGERYAGVEFAKQAIGPYLKAPTQAEYPWPEVVSTPLEPVEDLKGQTSERWLVAGYVDAPNSFGVMLRQAWTVEMLEYEGEYILGLVTLEGETVIESQGYTDILGQDAILRQARELKESQETGGEIDRERWRALGETIAKLRQTTRHEYDVDKRGEVVDALKRHLTHLPRVSSNFRDDDDYNATIDALVVSAEKFASEDPPLEEIREELRELIDRTRGK